MRDDKSIMDFINRFEGALSRHLRGMVLKKGIEKVSDFLYFTRNELMGTRCGNLTFLEFKKALIECGYQYDNDTADDIERKIKEPRVIKNDALLKLRFKILERDGFRCQYCGRGLKVNPEVELQIDHIHPDSKGGLFAEDNLVTSCRECNLGKSDIILSARTENERQ